MRPIVAVLLVAACGGEATRDGASSATRGDAAPDAFGRGGSADAAASDGGPAPPEGGAGGRDATATPSAAGAVSQVRGGMWHTCALSQDGRVKCWGMNGAELGLGTASAVGAPSAYGDDEALTSVPDVDVGGAATALAVGDRHACVLLDGGRVRCWGAWGLGLTGYPGPPGIDVGDDEPPASMGDVDIGAAALEVTIGTSRACALLADHTVRCWGFGTGTDLGYLDNATIGDDEPPSAAPAIDFGEPMDQVAAGDQSGVCVLFRSGAVRCWARGGDQPGVVRDIDLPVRATAVRQGVDHACAVLEDGRASCWGRRGWEWESEATDDGPPYFTAPIVYDLGAPVLDVAPGWGRTCALLQGGSVRCWGRHNGNGELGYGHVDPVSFADLAREGDVPLGARATALDCGWASCCAVVEGGALRCWGNGDSGVLGYGDTEAIGDDEPAGAGGNLLVWR